MSWGFFRPLFERETKDFIILCLGTRLFDQFGVVFFPFFETCGFPYARHKGYGEMIKEFFLYLGCLWRLFSFVGPLGEKE